MTQPHTNDQAWLAWVARTANRIAEGDDVLAEEIAGHAVEVILAQPSLTRKRAEQYAQVCMRNRKIDIWRHERTRYRLLREIDWIEGRVAPDPASRGGGTVQDAVASLPARPREVVILRALRYEWHEISEMLGISTATAKRDLARARTHVAAALRQGKRDTTWC